MTKIIYSRSFLKKLQRIPEKTRIKLSKQLELLQKNTFHKSLKTKALVAKLTGFYSFRITRDWRVIFQFKNKNVLELIDIGLRKDIYK